MRRAFTVLFLICTTLLVQADVEGIELDGRWELRSYSYISLGADGIYADRFPDQPTLATLEFSESTVLYDSTLFLWRWIEDGSTSSLPGIVLTEVEGSQVYLSFSDIGDGMLLVLVTADWCLTLFEVCIMTKVD